MIRRARWWSHRPAGEPALFRREMDDQVAVVVQGLIDLSDTVPSQRPVNRVTLTMPDFVADTLAHVLALGCRAAAAVPASHAPDRPGGPLEQEVIDALFAASRVAGYRCPAGHAGWPALRLGRERSAS